MQFASKTRNPAQKPRAQIRVVVEDAPSVIHPVQTSTGKIGEIGEKQKGEQMDQRGDAYYTPQRTSNDCVLAAFATALGRPYEDIAAAFGYPCDPASGRPSLHPFRAIAVQEILHPLRTLGILPSVVLTKESIQAHALSAPSSEDLKRIIQGHNAVLFIPDERFPGANIQHAVAWKNGRTIDCREPGGTGRGLDELVLLGAVLLTEKETPATCRDRAEAIIAEAFGRAKPVFLAFSGGKESLALLKLCEPYRGRFKLLWANTGHTFPHVESLVRAVGERFGLVEVAADLPGNWQANGLPSEVVTVNSALSYQGEIRLQPWAVCCYALKSLPLLNHLADHAGPVTVIHGQRANDGWRAQMHSPGNVTIVAPLGNWTTDDVFAFLKAESVALPAHYSEIPDSLDCWICPAHWSGQYGAAYARYVSREYPDVARAVLPTVRKIHSHINRVARRMQDALDGASSLSGPEGLGRYAGKDAVS